MSKKQKIIKIGPKTSFENVEANKSRQKENVISIYDRAFEHLSTLYDLRYNVVNELVEFKNKDSMVPWTAIESTADLLIELDRSNIKMSESKLDKLLNSSMIPAFDPFLEYFKSIQNQWDGSTDYISMLCDYIKLSEGFSMTDFKDEFKKMLVRVVACALDQKVVNRQIFLFVASGAYGQNIGKTEFWRWLVPDELKNYYTENFDFHNKDSQISMSEMLIVNLDDLENYDMAMIRHLKSTVSKADDTNRRAYAARQKRRIRRCSFVGSTNECDFLTDLTGNTRWVVFSVVSLDWQSYIKAIKPEWIWAHAYGLYKSGFRFFYNAEEIKRSEKRNESFLVQTDEQLFIARNFEPSTQDNEDAFFVTANDLCVIMTTISGNITKHYAVIRMGKVLRKLGYRPTTQYNPAKCYSEKGYFVIIDKNSPQFEYIKSELNRILKKNKN